MKERSYVEYAVYRHFRSLDEKSRSLLLRKAARRAGEMTAAEDVTPLLYKLEGMYVSLWRRVTVWNMSGWSMQTAMKCTASTRA